MICFVIAILSLLCYHVNNKSVYILSGLCYSSYQQEVAQLGI
nr:MAG TPA: hypothetical protein [Caudoviricetes sp.]DAP78081.1 MAG TPA: hypothetical protein [Caudoviricetes sp.]DAX18878.1 MAG TPA: hypothetical protein [Caudoviricetes sp.]